MLSHFAQLTGQMTDIGAQPACLHLSMPYHIWWGGREADKLFETRDLRNSRAPDWRGAVMLNDSAPR